MNSWSHSRHLTLVPHQYWNPMYINLRYPAVSGIMDVLWLCFCKTSLFTGYRLGSCCVMTTSRPWHVPGQQPSYLVHADGITLLRHGEGAGITLPGQWWGVAFPCVSVEHALPLGGISTTVPGSSIFTVPGLGMFRVSSSISGEGGKSLRLSEGWGQSSRSLISQHMVEDMVQHRVLIGPYSNKGQWTST